MATQPDAEPTRLDGVAVSGLRRLDLPTVLRAVGL